MKEFKYKTSFSSQIRALIPEEKDRYLALASLLNIGDFIPNINTEVNVDLLPVAFNACVANRVNKNGDVIDTATAIAIHENFLNKPINIEHNRTRVIGTILTAGFSEFGTDKPLTLEQVKDTSSPFNVTLGGVIWKVVNSEIANFIEDSSDPTSDNYLKISASWELGFSDFNIVLLKNNEKNIENGEIIAEESRIEDLKEHLKALGGKEIVSENTRAYRLVMGNVLPLGIGLTETPAADVEGILSITKNNLANSTELDNNISQNPHKDVIKKENIMKIESIKDITEESLKEVSASVIADFIESEIRKASEKFSEEQSSLNKELQDAKEGREVLSKNHEELTEKLLSVEKALAELEQQKQDAEVRQTFNERMSLLDEEYELSDEDREVIASDIKDMNSENFESYSKKLSIFLKNKNKKFMKKNFFNKEEADHQKVKADAKASESTEEIANTEVIESVIEKAQQEDVAALPNSSTAENETLVRKYRKAFAIDQFDFNK